MPEFQSIFRFFALFCIGQISLQQHKGSHTLADVSGVAKYLFEAMCSLRYSNEMR